MKRLFLLVPAVLFVTGCAGGWRNGPPAGYAGPGTPATMAPGGAPEATAVAAPAAAPKAAKSAKAAASGGATETTEGVRFVWTGGGGSANVAGEFNSWSTSADPMVQQDDGSFVLVKKLAPGRYAYKFVIDGTNWKEDPNAAETVDDGFGGKNAIVVVTGEGGTAPAPAAGAPAAAPAAASAAGTTATAGGVTFTWKGDASTVHLAGEFNAWSTTADPLTKQADGSWTIKKALEPGRYAYKFVIDGTNWKEDPNATESVDDGYGGKNSVVVVGAGAAAAAAPAAPAATGTANTGKPPVASPDGVRFFFPGAHKSVHLAGDFNGWSTTADPMSVGDDGLWTILKKIEPGTYAYKFVVDGTTWKQDEANPESVDDGFGGKNSVITVK